MSGLVFFDDDTNNDVLDEWMNNDSATLAKGASLGSELPAAETKGGLGYADSAKGAKQNKAAVDSKQQKQQLLNKKKQNITKVDHDDDELHGVVTDMGEESRTSVVSRKDKDALNQKRKADSAQKSNKKQKAQTGAQGNNSASAASAPNSDTNKVGSEAKDQASVGKVSAGTGTAPAGKKDINSGTNTSGAAAVSDDADKRVNSRIRKRTKTRSKQKNIRKDNRSDTLKPAHLVVKNKDYQGRALTDRTKAVLGVV
jgi:hypothetical protein